MEHRYRVKVIEPRPFGGEEAGQEKSIFLDEDKFIGEVFVLYGSKYKILYKER